MENNIVLQNIISNVERVMVGKRGRSIPKTDKLQKIADYFGVSVDYLLGNEQKEKAPSLDEKKPAISVALFYQLIKTNELVREFQASSILLFKSDIVILRVSKGGRVLNSGNTYISENYLQNILNEMKAVVEQDLIYMNTR